MDTDLETNGNFNPHDEALKKQLHEKADKLNFVGSRKGTTVLYCGAVKKGNPCKQLAGNYTDHFGHGRCKFHGGLTTGPKTEEGKAITAQNATKHGLYSKGLSPAEREIYEELLEKPKIDLSHEIRLLQTKIITYLEEWRRRYEYYEQTLGVHEADKKMKVWYTTGENGDKGCYHAGTIEDRPLIRALNELAKMVEKNARLDPEGNEDLLSIVNKELQAASHGKITVAWGARNAQAIQSTLAKC